MFTKEKEPFIKFRKRRIRKWDCIIGHRFFDTSLGFFTVQKVWKCREYCKNALTPTPSSHWFEHYTIQIKTESGEKLIMRKLDFDLKDVFEKPCDKPRKH